MKRTQKQSHSTTLKWQSVLRMLLVTTPVLLSACHTNNSQSSAEDVTVYKGTITCTAEWMCKGETQPKGSVSTNKGETFASNDACQQNLLTQLAGKTDCAPGQFTLQNFAPAPPAVEPPVPNDRRLTTRNGTF